MDALLAAISADFLGKPAWIWLSFIGIVIALLAFDLGVLHRKTHEIGVAESLWLSAGYIAMGCLFGAWVWWYLGSEPGMQYFTGFFVEKSLAMDNVFVISLIFTYFAIPRIYQHRVLVWGILGVIVLRGIMIGLGAALINEFDWILFIFGAFLLITGIKMLVIADKEPDIAGNPILKFLRKHLNVTDELHGEKFFVKAPDPKGSGKLVRFATPLFLALVLIEFADLIFAVELRARDLRDHDRSLHRLYQQHLRDPGPARAVLRPGRDGAPLPLSQIRAVAGADLHRRQDLLQPVLRQARPGDLPLRDLRAAAGRRHRLAGHDEKRR